MNERSNSRRGISRFDVVLVIAILTLLSQLFLPAMQHGREAARAYQCRANIRQLGVALHTYHDQFSAFPPAATWGSEGLDLATMNELKESTPIHLTRQNWIQMLLPALGQTELANRFDPAYPAWHDKNREASLVSVPGFNCPSDPFNHRDNLYRMPLPDGSNADFARGNYAINGGTEFVPAKTGTLSNPSPTNSRYVFDEKGGTFHYLGSGIAGVNIGLSLRDFENGSSTLVALEELRAGLDPIDTRGVWSLGQIGASITWGHGVGGDDGGPNKTSLKADDIRFGAELYDKLDHALIDSERMQFCYTCDDNDQATARSKHEGGVYVLTLDGAVHFVADNVESTLWHVMHSRRAPPELFTEQFASELNGYDPNAERPKSVGTRKPTPEPPPENCENSIGMKFTRVLAGEFTMSLPDANLGAFFPIDLVPHPVRITHNFLMGTHEVTQSQYQAIISRNPSWHSATGDGKELLDAEDTGTWPVENVAWNEAFEFCQKLGKLPDEMAAGRTYRLPTEAEWEYSCRGGIPGEINLPNWEEAQITGEIGGNRPPKGLKLLPQPVGSYPPNPFGLYDMCGNVFEWTADFRRQSYYANSPVEDPQGPSTGYLRIIRGWHWGATSPACKVYTTNEPWVGSRFIGFRVVCESRNGEEKGTGPNGT